MKKIVIIAAAGRGNRLGAGIPKCLVKVNGHFIFEYLLKAFSWADEIRMVVGYKAEDVIKEVSGINPNVRFIRNEDYASTTTLQSNYLGAQGLEGKAMFVDGDMILSKQTAEQLRGEYERGEEFVGVAGDISEDPVYAGVSQGQIEWFSYEKKAKFEWANVALLSVNKLEYLPTNFFTQIEKFLPLNSFEIERLEVDTKEDLMHAEDEIDKWNDRYDYWKNQ